jgi:hypothetical protein
VISQKLFKEFFSKIENREHALSLLVWPLGANRFREGMQDMEVL